MSIAHCFVRHFQRRHPRELGAPEVEAFLAMLANEERRVSACAHNQALSALLFLYRAGLEQELPWLDSLQRPRRVRRLPVILTVGQVQAVLARMEGEHALLARLLYGTGMRLMEALWLRVKDVDFAHRTLIVREGKANTDRTLMLPQALEDGLRPVGLCPFPSAAGSCRPLPGRGTAGGAGAQVSARRRGMGLALGIPAGHAEPRSALGRAAAGITGSIRPSSGRSSGQ